MTAILLVLEIAAAGTLLAGDLLLAFAEVGALLVSNPLPLDLIIAEMGVLRLRTTALGRVVMFPVMAVTTPSL